MTDVWPFPRQRSVRSRPRVPDNYRETTLLLAQLNAMADRMNAALDKVEEDLQGREQRGDHGG